MALKLFQKIFHRQKTIYLEEKKQFKFFWLLILIISLSWLIIYFPPKFYSELFKNFLAESSLFFQKTFEYFSYNFQNFQKKSSNLIEVPFVGYYFFYTSAKDYIGTVWKNVFNQLTNLANSFQGFSQRILEFSTKISKINSFFYGLSYNFKRPKLKESKDLISKQDLNLKQNLFTFFSQKKNPTKDYLNNLISLKERTKPNFTEFQKKKFYPQANLVFFDLQDNSNSTGGDIQEKIKVEELIPLNLTAKGFLIKTINNKELVIKNSEEKFTLASLTKIMTALIAIENYQSNEIFEINLEDIKQTGDYQIEAGQSFDRDSMLRFLLLVSANDVAWSLARKMGVSNFVKLMNQKAQEIGMKNTIFVDPTGLDLGNISTPQDFFLLAKYIYFNYPQLIEILGEKKATVISQQNKIYFLENRIFKFNPFDETIEILGGKTGYLPTIGYNILMFVKTSFETLIVISFNDVSYFQTVKEVLPKIIDFIKVNF